MTGQTPIEYTPRLGRRWATRNRAAETGAVTWTTDPVPLRPGDTVDFHASRDPRDPKRAQVRVVSDHYALLTATVQNRLWYTLISWADGWRGPMPTDSTIPAQSSAAEQQELLERLEAACCGDPGANPKLGRLAAHRARRLDIAAVRRGDRTIWG